jgi:hypothetical protein
MIAVMGVLVDRLALKGFWRKVELVWGFELLSSGSCRARKGFGTLLDEL